jgi:hypothetical protein
LSIKGWRKVKGTAVQYSRFPQDIKGGDNEWEWPESQDVTFLQPTSIYMFWQACIVFSYPATEAKVHGYKGRYMSFALTSPMQRLHSITWDARWHSAETSNNYFTLDHPCSVDLRPQSL